MLLFSFIPIRQKATLGTIQSFLSIFIGLTIEFIDNRPFALCFSALVTVYATVESGGAVGLLISVLGMY